MYLVVSYPNFLYVLGPTSLNVLHHRTRTNRDVESNESEIQKLGKTQEPRLIHDFFINDYVRKFILRLFPELKGEENRFMLDYMTNEVVKDMKAMKTTDWQQMSNTMLPKSPINTIKYFQ